MPILPRLTGYGPTWRGRLALAADGLVAAILLVLPFSTSVTAILVTLFMAATLARLTLAEWRAGLADPGTWLPVALWGLACLGMLWADVAWPERLDGLRAFHKLLVMPLFLLHFRSSHNTLAVGTAFLASTTLLLCYSWASWWWPGLVIGNRVPGVPVKDTIYQGVCFALAAAILVYAGARLAQARRFLAAALCAGIVAAILANLTYVANSRTALVLLPLLLAIVGFFLLGRRGAGIAVASVVVAAGVGWNTSQYLRDRVAAVGDVAAYENVPHPVTSEALRMQFWRQSLEALRRAPLVGHGTGAVRATFARAVQEGRAPPESVAENPHNQTFFTGVQLGLVGIALLYLMWFFHLRYFRGSGWAAQIGLLVVGQNIVACLFNSHLADFTAGWLYVVGVGLLGGTVLARRR